MSPRSGWCPTDNHTVPTLDAERMPIESALPEFDAVIVEHVTVAADTTTTFRAAKTLDLLTVRTPLLVASMWVRVLPARLLGRAARPPPSRNRRSYFDLKKSGRVEPFEAG